MSLEKLAKALGVDEVNVMHGPKGVAVHVRIEKSWLSATIDNEMLEHRRMEVIAEHLVHLADGHVHKVRSALRKGHSGFDAATQAALRADAETQDRRMLTWGDVGGFDKALDGPAQQQVSRIEPVPFRRLDPMPPPAEPAVSEPMQSRFHAVVAELRNL